jgi:3-oxoacyl-[acyl-carrier-protein] synthase II
MERDVVITGLGVVSGLGVGVRALWEGLVEGRSALAPVRSFDASGFRCAHAAEVPEFKARDYVPKSYRKAVKVMARDIELAVAAAKLAVDDAGVTTAEATWGGAEPGETTYPRRRMGCQIGAGLIAAEVEELTRALVTSLDEAGDVDLRRWGAGDGGEAGMNNLPPLWLLKYLPNMLACHVTILHGTEGPSNTITCAEASGGLCLGESSRVIERDDADMCLSGGAESKINHMGMIRMDFAGRIAEVGPEDEAWRRVRPYDPASSGSVLGEAGAILVLESGEGARSRGAKIYARIAGFGAGHSSPPIIPPLPDEAGEGIEDGLVVAIESALADAGIDAGEIDAIVPHACGVPVLDKREAGALGSVFGSRLGEIPLVTLVPSIGECNAGAGGVQAAVAACCLHEQRLPARLNAGRPAMLNGVEPLGGASESVRATLRSVLVCSGSLGGQNAALVLRAVE